MHPISMKAIVYYQYGSPDMLALKEIERPIPKANEVLIKVHAASINSWDWDLLRGKPYIVRIGGLSKPKYNVLGADVSGIVEAVGEKVKKFKPGDEVFGDLCACNWGGFAEYVCAKENALANKPACMSFEEAAALPQAGVMALQSVRDEGKTKPGDKILMNGAGGGVGTLAVQMAKSYGAEVTAVDGAPKLDMLRSLGADHVIDYQKEDFTKNGKQYDLIIDVVANRSMIEYKRSLNPGGRFLMVGGSASTIIQSMTMGPLMSMTGNKKLGVLVHEPNKNLDFFETLYEEEKVKPVIDRCYPLHDAAEAFRYFGGGHMKGKVVIKVNLNV